MDNIPEITVHILNGNHSEEEMFVFMQWYNESAENKDLFFQMKYIYDLLNEDRKPNEEEIKESWNRLLAKENSKRTNASATLAVKNEDSNEVKQKNRIRKIFITGVAAAAMLLFAIGIKINSDNNSWIEVQSISPRELTVVDLPDGSTVHLNASSTLKYPKRFNKKSRNLYLNGEAYFVVAENHKHPFIVHSDKIDIEVLGTEFNVQAYSTDDIAVTTLILGKVKLITYEGTENIQNEFILQPGEQAAFDKVSNITMITSAESKIATSWMNGEYSFKNKSLEEISERLEKIYGITFVIEDESIKEELFTGKFFLDQSIEEIVDIINFKKQFSYYIINDTVYMHRK